MAHDCEVRGLKAQDRLHDSWPHPTHTTPLCGLGSTMTEDPEFVKVLEDADVDISNKCPGQMVRPPRWLWPVPAVWRWPVHPKKETLEHLYRATN